MPRFLIDVNLPYRSSVWSGVDFAHMRDIGETWTDSPIWQYARERDMVIVSKDTDFSDRAMISAPPSPCRSSPVREYADARFPCLDLPSVAKHRRLDCNQQVGSGL
jgi:hypothetical protein